MDYLRMTLWGWWKTMKIPAIDQRVYYHVIDHCDQIFKVVLWHYNQYFISKNISFIWHTSFNDWQIPDNKNEIPYERRNVKFRKSENFGQNVSSGHAYCYRLKVWKWRKSLSFHYPWALLFLATSWFLMKL